MPCDSVQRSTVQFMAKSTDVRLLKKALEAMGYTVTEQMSMLHFYNYSHRGTYDRTTGQLNARGREELDIDAVKRQYSKQIVLAQAKENGWDLAWTTNEQGQEEATVQKSEY